VTETTDLIGERLHKADLASNDVSCSWWLGCSPVACFIYTS
jgi:hypothetical protein